MALLASYSMWQPRPPAIQCGASTSVVDAAAVLTAMVIGIGNEFTRADVTDSTLSATTSPSHTEAATTNDGHTESVLANAGATPRDC